VTQDESQVSVGGLLALDQVLEDSWSSLTYFGLSHPVEGQAKDEAEIMGSQPCFGSFLGFGNM
jgi:hypothetical protein